MQKGYAIVLSAAAALALVGVGYITAAADQADAQSHIGNPLHQQTQTIFLVRIDRPKFNLDNGSIATITPTFINTGHILTHVTVIISLWRGGNFIDDVTYTDIPLEHNVEYSCTFATIPLMQGSYTIKAVFTRQNGATIQTFPNLGTIAVNS